MKICRKHFLNCSDSNDSPSIRKPPERSTGTFNSARGGLMMARPKRLGAKEMRVCPSESTLETIDFNSITQIKQYKLKNTVLLLARRILKAQSLPGILPPELVKLPYLQEIDLTRNYLNGTIPKEWGSMQLINISLDGNRLSGVLPIELANITTLRSFTLEFNNVSGVIPPEFGSMVSIERMLLASNNFTGPLPETLAKLTTLKEFRISDNHFTGKIPDFIQNWTNLDKIEIQASGLEGPIPLGISLCTKISDLRISDLKGREASFPPLSNMSNLRTLSTSALQIAVKSPLYYVNDDLGNPITNTLLNGNNYLSWSYAVEHFIRAKKKSKILTGDPLDSTDLTYEDWMTSNSMVLTWLWNSMEPKVALLLNGLNSEYSVYNDQILARVIGLSTHSNRGGHGNYTSGRGVRGNYGNGRGNRGRGDKYDGVDERKCTHCGKDGHTEPFCWNKYGQPFAYANQVSDHTFGPFVAATPSDLSTANVLGQILHCLNSISVVRCEEVPPLPVIPCEEMPPLPGIPCEEVPSRVPIMMKGTMPIYAQHHRTFPRKKVVTVESAIVTTIEPAPNHSSSSIKVPSIPVKSIPKRIRS
ncbi:hypothetical protein IFM89_013684 [Coptis chinensis]|uniref:Retrotransposon Copia-like N-terminal domain-containing protein n=1 Tax=Coptis chinensis TaxID=261450 RepID=A0A835IPV2_9MAGN|nr:hypothetical protein IFM89_013684 [Coptis chinensis]